MRINETTTGDLMWGTDNVSMPATTFTAPSDAPPYLADIPYGTNKAAFSWPRLIDSLVIPDVLTIDLRTGKVEIADDADLDEAALEFWKAVERQFGPFIREAIEDAMLEAL